MLAENAPRLTIHRNLRNCPGSVVSDMWQAKLKGSGAFRPQRVVGRSPTSSFLFPPPMDEVHGIEFFVTAQVVSCLMCDVPTHGVWGLGPQRVAGRRPAAFSRLGSRERSGRDPSRFFPFPPPMDEVHGIEFFFGVSRIRDFWARKPASRAVTILLTALGPGYGKAMGAPPPNPLCCPQNANNREGRKKEKKKAWGLFAPKPPTRNRVPGPHQWVHRILDTMEPGQLPIYYAKLIQIG